MPPPTRSAPSAKSTRCSATPKRRRGSPGIPRCRSGTYTWRRCTTRCGQRMGAEMGMALADLIRAGELRRLKICAAPDCEAALMDLSRNRSGSSATPATAATGNTSRPIVNAARNRAETWLRAYRSRANAVIAAAADQRVGRLQARQHGRLDASGVQTAVGPVTGQHKIVVAAFVRPEAEFVASGDRLHVAVRGIDVDADVLRRQRRQAGMTVGTAE